MSMISLVNEMSEPLSQLNSIQDGLAALVQGRGEMVHVRRSELVALANEMSEPLVQLDSIQDGLAALAQRGQIDDELLGKRSKRSNKRKYYPKTKKGCSKRKMTWNSKSKHCNLK